MSAQVLRAAAAELRSLAEKAEPGRWKLWGMQVMADPKGTGNVDDAIPVARVASPSWCLPSLRTWNASYIAAMDPTVGLAVADWLEMQAEVETRLGGPDYETPADHPALALATALTPPPDTGRRNT